MKKITESTLSYTAKPIFAAVIKQIFGIFLFSFFLHFCLGAQGDTNPFELTPRLKAAAAAEKANQAFVPANPFDIQRKTLTETAEEAEGITAEPEIIEENYINPTEVKEQFNRFFFITYMVLLVLLTVGFILFRNTFAKVWRAFLNDNILSQLHREQGLIAGLPYLFMNVLFFANAALFIILAAKYYNWHLPGKSMTGTFFILTAGITGVFIIKHLLLKIVSYIFPVSKEARLYSFTITVFSAVLGFFLIPLNACLAYMPEGMTFSVLILVLIVIAGVYLFRSLRGLLIGSRYLSGHQFHFLLYICAVEAAPVLILLRKIIG